MMDFGESVFRFYFGKPNTAVAGSTSLPFGDYAFVCDEQTPAVHAAESKTEILLFGYAVDVTADHADGAAAQLVKATTVAELLETEKRLGGKYLIFARLADRLYIVPDATASVPLFYRFADGLACSSDMALLSSDLQPDVGLQAIRAAGDISQAMPYDLTAYAEIRQLIPNHYLDLSAQKAVRVVQQPELLPAITAENAAATTLPMLRRLCRFYAEQFSVYCPLTAGRDSRVVLALLLETDPHVPCYTMRHSEHTGKETDLTVSAEIAAKLSLPYRQVVDVTVPESSVQLLDAVMGEDAYSQRTLRLALTVASHCADGAVFNGDIIGQIGKCSLHRDIPAALATPGYFRCKLHNYSSGAKNVLANWLGDIKRSGETVSPFDLFSVENRLGRWAAQENSVYNAIGQRYFNLFNSRSIIYIWTLVPRSSRKHSAIHTALLAELRPELAALPYEKDGAAASIAKANGLFYWLSSYLKYALERTKFILKRGK